MKQTNKFKQIAKNGHTILHTLPSFLDQGMVILRASLAAVAPDDWSRLSTRKSPYFPTPTERETCRLVSVSAVG